ncbi:MAG: sigma-70 family RNA polymerase sigma factor [Bacteroidota bacterium]|nr:sigma-70 family RNA polymerase sigma factor [Bacteroidota bacterium]
MLTAKELIQHIGGCSLNNRESQKKIYYTFYGYAISICLRYTNKQEDAVEILNDGFLKIFKEIHRFTPAYTDVTSSFKGWLAKIMVYTAIDYNRKYHHQELMTFLNGKVIEMPSVYENALDKISYEEIIQAVQNLSPAYRTIFNLFVIEGFTHGEIARKLKISVGTSKSNLSKAKRHLQQKLVHHYTPLIEKNAI